MAFETTICEECPNPIHWQQLRKHYLFLINTALDVRNAKLKEQDQIIAVLRDEVKAWRAWHKTEPEIYVEEVLLYQAAINAKKNTDAAKALEEK